MLKVINQILVAITTNRSLLKKAKTSNSSRDWLISKSIFKYQERNEIIWRKH